MSSVAPKSDYPRGLLRAAEYLFLLYIFLIPFNLLFSFRLGDARIQAIDAVFLLSFLVWILALTTRSTPFRSSRLYFFVALYLAAMSFSTIFSVNPWQSLVKLVGVYYLAALAVLTLNLSLRNGFARRALLAFVLGAAVTGIGTIVAVAGFYLNWEFARPMLSHYGSLPVGNYPRVRSLFENANMASNYLNVAVAAIIALLRSGWIKLSVGIAAGLLAGVASLFTISPGIGGAVLTLGLLFWALQKTERPAAARYALWLSIAFAAVVLISTTLSPGLISASRTNAESAYSVRVRVWLNSLDRAFEYPVLGRGTGTNTAEVSFVAPSGQKQFLTDAHNAWLNILGQSGIVGLVAFSLLCSYCWSICRFHFETPDSEQLVLLTASCGLVGAFFYQNLFGSYEDARHLWVWIGFTAAAHQRLVLSREI